MRRVNIYRIIADDDRSERGTSSHCALCGQPAARPVRSRVLCYGGHELHADVNGALNLLYREPEVRARAEGRPAVADLAVEGLVEWGGGKPRGAVQPPLVRGGSISGIVVGGRR